MANKPSIPKGTRDFLPSQVMKRRYIFNTIESVFQTYGYLPIETPTMEELDTLTGKYGEEGDQLLFKVLNNGKYLEKANKEAIASKDYATLTPSISKRGLRYDLTIPFARYVVMHQNEIAFPFKRYQIQPVWRADRPQKGRYQEFYQCDVDIVGSTSLMYEAELVRIYDEVFTRLGLKTVTLINNRKILFGLAETAGIADQFMDMTIAIDKLDKIGADKVVEEMTKKGISEEAAKQVMGLLSSIHNLIDVFGEGSSKFSSKDGLGTLASYLETSKIAQEGVEELREFLSYHKLNPISSRLKFDITLARGLNYYTGCIFEVKADPAAYPELEMGSIGGGGRYDDLTSGFGMKDMSGVGVSFGAERIYDVMEELELFPDRVAKDLDVLLVAFDKPCHLYGFDVVTKLRAAGIKADLYPQPTKMKKQMKYANDRNVPYVIVIGSDEMQSGELTIKDMEVGSQSKNTITEIIAKLQS